MLSEVLWSGKQTSYDFIYTWNQSNESRKGLMDTEQASGCQQRGVRGRGGEGGGTEVQGAVTGRAAGGQRPGIAP